VAFKDKKITCKECGKEFDFTASEQEFYQEKGLYEPKRCSDCRKAKRQERFSDKRYEITCAQCGAKDTVPFEPKNPEGILCTKCFKESKGAGKEEKAT